MDFFKTPDIQIWFLGKDPVFKYKFLVLFSHPCDDVEDNDVGVDDDDNDYNDDDDDYDDD